jgi:hypothetical protein
VRKPRSLRSSLLIAAVTASLTGLVVTGSANASTPSPLAYAALGDSYSAGSGIPPAAPGAPAACAQSAMDYPHVIAAARGFQLTDVTCGGATTSNMTVSQYLGVPPQFAALNAATSVVTLGTGGNDNGFFASTLAECSLTDVVGLATGGAPCQQLFGGQLAGDISSDAPAIATALRQIHQISPKAKVFVVGYPDVLPQTGSCYSAIPIVAGDVTFINGLEKALNTMLRTAAQQNGATFVDTYTPSIGHDACQPAGVRWIEPFFGANGAVFVHPNVHGEAADAQDIQAAMSAAG